MAGGTGAAAAVVVSLLSYWIEAQRQPGLDINDVAKRLDQLEATAERLDNHVATLQESAAGQAAQAGQIIAIQGRISELAGATDALAQSVGGKAALEDLGRLRESLTELSQQTASNTNRLDTTETELRDLNEVIAEVRSEVDALENTLSAAQQSYQAEISALRGAQAKAAAAALIARDIEAAIDAGRDFTASLDRLTRVLDGDEQLIEMSASLDPYSAGVASLEQLVDDLDDIRRDASARRDGESIGWVGQTVENLRALVDIEGVPTSLSSFDQALKVARAAALEGDLATANGLLEPHQTEHERLPQWLDTSRDRQAAVAAIDEISHYLDELLSRQG